MPSVCTAPGVGIPSALRTHRKVMSTASCAPWLMGARWPGPLWHVGLWQPRPHSHRATLCCIAPWPRPLCTPWPRFFLVLLHLPEWRHAARCMVASCSWARHPRGWVERPSTTRSVNSGNRAGEHQPTMPRKLRVPFSTPTSIPTHRVAWAMWPVGVPTLSAQLCLGRCPTRFPLLCAFPCRALQHIGQTGWEGQCGGSDGIGALRTEARSATHIVRHPLQRFPDVPP